VSSAKEASATTAQIKPTVLPKPIEKPIRESEPKKVEIDKLKETQDMLLDVILGVKEPTPQIQEFLANMQEEAHGIRADSNTQQFFKIASEIAKAESKEFEDKCQKVISANPKFKEITDFENAPSEIYVQIISSIIEQNKQDERFVSKLALLEGEIMERELMAYHIKQLIGPEYKSPYDADTAKKHKELLMGLLNIIAAKEVNTKTLLEWNHHLQEFWQIGAQQKVRGTMLELIEPTYPNAIFISLGAEQRIFTVDPLANLFGPLSRMGTRCDHCQERTAQGCCEHVSAGECCPTLAPSEKDILLANGRREPFRPLDHAIICALRGIPERRACAISIPCEQCAFLRRVIGVK
jgi:hypothetical protein